MSVVNNHTGESRQNQIAASFALKKRAHEFPVPTDDQQVKLMLRQLGQPICLFAEDKAFRRERLKREIVTFSQQHEELPSFASYGGKDSSDSESQSEVFYTEGTTDLQQCRLQILKYSIANAKHRVATGNPQVSNSRLQELVNNVAPYHVTESQYADDRCVSRGCLSPAEDLFATSGWSSDCKVWGVPDC